jgi:pimeloyl-ACP methyl ester carboxylesterase
VTDGNGPNVLFIHGTGRSRTHIPIGLLRERMRVICYDRRGTHSWPLADGDPYPSVEEHASDAAAIIDRLAAGPAHICGLSFGGIVALELALRRPALVRTLVLFEPPLPADDRDSPVSLPLQREFRALVAAGDPEQAAERFHRRALSDATWERLPERARQRARAMWRHIDCDLSAKAAYRLSYRTLAALTMPVLLARGGRSRATFAASTDALHRWLPRARTTVLPSAGHYLDVAAWPAFARVLCEFVETAARDEASAR